MAAKKQGQRRKKTSPVDAQDALGRTKLHLACQSDDIERVRDLLEQGADPLTVDLADLDAMHMAIMHGSARVVDFLVTFMDIGKAHGSTGGSYLHFAAQQRNCDVVRTLLDAGADPNARDRGGWPPFIFACARNDFEMTKLLLERGADVNAANLADITALHASADADQKEMCELLLSYGANVDVKDREGKTPIEAATGQARAFLEKLARA